METTRTAENKSPSTLAFRDRPVDPALAAAVRRFTNHSASLAPGLVRATTVPTVQSSDTRDFTAAPVSVAHRTPGSTALIVVLLVTLGLSIAGFTVTRSLTNDDSRAASESITSIQADPTTPGLVIVESMPVEANSQEFPSAEDIPVHRFSISAQQASTLHVGETLPRRVAAPSAPANANETIAAIVIGLCLIGVGAIVISATGPTRASSMKRRAAK